MAIFYPGFGPQEAHDQVFTEKQANTGIGPCGHKYTHPFGMGDAWVECLDCGVLVPTGKRIMVLGDI